jgi:hypothetical protein
MCLDPEGTPEQIKVRGMSAYAGRTFEDIVTEEIAELLAFGITVKKTLKNHHRKRISIFQGCFLKVVLHSNSIMSNYFYFTVTRISGRGFLLWKSKPSYPPYLPLFTP